jgi:hypothetical protein
MGVVKGVSKVYRQPIRQAVCRNCGNTWDGSNALAVGARHAAAHRHVVDVDYRVLATYVPTGMTVPVRPRASRDW